jgi:hypothetical protein
MGQLAWIASYAKSGDTWMRAILHDSIRQPDAPPDINRLADLCASDVNAGRFRRRDPRRHRNSPLPMCSGWAGWCFAT